MFILRAAFWLSLLVILIPGDPESGRPAPSVSVMEAFGAASATISDFSSFCDRNPGVCATGSTAIQGLAQRVEYGVGVVRDYLDTHSAGANSDTLAPEDLLPPWQGPDKPDGIA